jgi:hypothetical protein
MNSEELADRASGKVSKASVSYGTGSRHRKCVDCTMFRVPHSCTLVAGWISPDGVCDKFVRKK